MRIPIAVPAVLIAALACSLPSYACTGFNDLFFTTLPPLRSDFNSAIHAIKERDKFSFTEEELNTLYAEARLAYLKPMFEYADAMQRTAVHVRMIEDIRSRLNSRWTTIVEDESLTLDGLLALAEEDREDGRDIKKVIDVICR